MRCADLILGHNFLKLHEFFILELGGSKPPIKIYNERTSNTICSVSVAKVTPPRLFQFLDDDIKPITTKPRRFSLENKKFIDGETAYCNWANTNFCWFSATSHFPNLLQNNTLMLFLRLKQVIVLTPSDMR